MGTVPFAEAEALQNELVDQRKAGKIPDTLLLLEHLPVITLGRTARAEFIREAGAIPVVRTARGGEVTYHGPGQLVAYPILKLEHGDLHRYLRNLEQVIIDLAADYGLHADRDPGRTGVWVGADKLASIGIRASGWVTSHGVALNRTRQSLEGFEAIVPCALEGIRMTSLETLLGRPVPRAEVEERFYHHFGRIMGREIQ